MNKDTQNIYEAYVTESPDQIARIDKRIARLQSQKAQLQQSGDPTTSSSTSTSTTYATVLAFAPFQLASDDIEKCLIIIHQVSEVQASGEMRGPSFNQSISGPTYVYIHIHTYVYIIFKYTVHICVHSDTLCIIL